MTKFLWKSKITILFGFVLMMLFSACNTAKYLEPDQYYVHKNIIKIDKTVQSSKERSSLEYDLSTLISPKQKPNERLHWRVWFYFRTAGPDHNSRLDRWIKKKIVEPPAFVDDELTQETVQSMTYYLQSKGYFLAEVYSEKYVSGKRKQNIVYQVSPKQVYTIDTLIWHCSDTAMYFIIRDISDKTYLKKGQPISSGLYDLEKNRITRAMRNRGYYNFASNYISPIDGDSADYKTKLEITILPPPDAAKHQVYHIGEISVYPQYTPSENLNYSTDTTINGLRFLSSSPNFEIKPDVISERIYFKTDSLYRQEDVEKTIQQLDNLGIYKFVNVKPEPSTTDPNLINFSIYLNPTKKMVFDAGIEANFSSISSARSTLGTAFSMDYKHRNIFGGAEQLSTSLLTGLEATLGEDKTRFAYDVRLSAELKTPKLSDVFGELKLLRKAGLLNKSFYTLLKERGSTLHSVSYNYLKLLDFYSYNLFTGNLGYYLPVGNKSFTINQIGINYFIPKTEAKFDSIAKNNTFIRESFGKQLFTGFVFRDITFQNSNKTDQFGGNRYYRVHFEQSGAEMLAINEVYNAFALVPKHFTLFNSIEFSKYLRLDLEAGFTKGFSGKKSFALRFSGGIAIPMGNTPGVPYVKQFYVGGPNSIRAWRIRGIGPGGHIDPISNNTRSRIPAYQTGDMKLEFNAEFRFPVFWRLESALFLDGGNIWTIEKDPERPEGVISSNFYKQIALGTGLGARLDFTYFIFRLDLGYPLRNPFPNENNSYWSYHRFSSLKVRDINYNLAIGYPF